MDEVKIAPEIKKEAQNLQHSISQARKSGTETTKKSELKMKPATEMKKSSMMNNAGDTLVRKSKKSMQIRQTMI